MTTGTKKLQPLHYKEIAANFVILLTSVYRLLDNLSNFTRSYCTSTFSNGEA